MASIRFGARILASLLAVAISTVVVQGASPRSVEACSLPTVSPTADCLSPHAYTQQADYDTQYGVYFSSYYVNDISSDYANTSEDGGSFITKEEWELFSSSQWIEAGSITGYLLSYGAWTGSFVGANTCNSSGTCSYQAFTAGSADPTGVHDYEIQYVGNNEWGPMLT